MGGPLQIILSDIYITRTENELKKPLFCRRIVDGMENTRKKKKNNSFFQKLDNYDPKINLIIEENPSKFLDAKIVNNNDSITIEVYKKTSKQSLYWPFRLTKRFKQNVSGYLHRTKRISFNFEMEIKLIKRKIINVVCQAEFVNSFIII